SALAGSGSGRRCQGGALALELAQAEDCLDAGDLPLGLDDLTGCLEPLGLALEPEAEQVVLDFLERELQLFIGLLAKLGGLAHRHGSLVLGPWSWVVGRRPSRAVLSGALSGSLGIPPDPSARVANR